MSRTMAVPCRRDLACFRNDGHPGECMYPTPETEPRPALARTPMSAAGRRLIADYLNRAIERGATTDAGWLTTAVLAIEAETNRDALVWVRALVSDHMQDPGCDCTGMDAFRSVLADIAVQSSTPEGHPR